MSLTLSIRPARVALGSMMVAAVALTLAGPAAPAHAAVSSCRADPIVWVGASKQNQYKIVVQAAVGVNNAAEVQTIVYTLHIPAGQTLYSVTYTGGAMRGKESVVVVADGAASTFTVMTRVATSTPGHSVSVQQAVTHPGWNSGSPSATATGTDAQDVQTSVYLN